MKVLVYVKGKPRPLLMENVGDYAVLNGGALRILFEDGSAILLADGQWREVDVDVRKTEPAESAQLPLEGLEP